MAHDRVRRLQPHHGQFPWAEPENGDEVLQEGGGLKHPAELDMRSEIRMRPGRERERDREIEIERGEREREGEERG